jgi:hypothetical protein
MHALAREPDFRPASVAELAAELGARSATRAAPTMPLPRYGSTPRKRRWFVAAALILALAVAAIVVAITTGGSGTRPPPPRRASVSAPARGATPADEARNLAAWLRAHSR